MGLQITSVDLSSDAQMRALHDVVERAQRHGRPDALLEAYPAFVEAHRHPSSAVERELLIARLDGVVVGGCHLERSLGENAQVGEVEVNVHPEHRRQGIGTALLDRARHRMSEAGCTSLLCEVNTAPTGALWPGMAFALSVGATSQHSEQHLVLDLPASAPDVVLPSGYELITWRDRCPEEELAAYCALRTQMNADVPRGKLEWTPEVRTPEQQRESELRMAKSYVSLNAAVRHVCDGALVAYTLMLLPQDSPVAWQDDTFVDRAHRGQRLGLILKNATLTLLESEHPERTVIHTWTDPDNHPMQRTNHQFGFRVVEVMHEMQLQL